MSGHGHGGRGKTKGHSSKTEGQGFNTIDVGDDRNVKRPTDRFARTGKGQSKESGNDEDNTRSKRRRRGRHHN